MIDDRYKSKNGYVGCDITDQQYINMLEYAKSIENCIKTLTSINEEREIEGLNQALKTLITYILEFQYYLTSASNLKYRPEDEVIQILNASINLHKLNNLVKKLILKTRGEFEELFEIYYLSQYIKNILKS